VSSVGALLDFLTRERATGELDDVDETMESDICGIEVLALYATFFALFALLNIC
jgi:hypothetical protein